MASNDGGSPVPRIAFSRLYAFARDPNLAAAPDIRGALTRNPQLATDFRRIVERRALARMPRVAAASTDPITVRHGEGCRIRFEESRAEQDQIYVIIELADANARPQALFIFDEQQFCRPYPLPSADKGVIQLLEHRNGPLVVGLRDIKAEVILS